MEEAKSPIRLRPGCDSKLLAEKIVPKNGPNVFEAAVTETCAGEGLHAIRINVRPAFYATGDDRQLGISVHELALCG